MDDALYDGNRRNEQDCVIEWLMTYIKHWDPQIDEAFVRPHEYKCWKFSGKLDEKLWKDTRYYFIIKKEDGSWDVMRSFDETQTVFYIVKFDV